jgi:hypothetical protein
MSAVGAFVLLSRGEVRLVRVVVVFVFCFSFIADDLDEDEDRDALEEIEASGVRARVTGAGRGAFIGDERVRSRVSTASDECLN